MLRQSGSAMAGDNGSSTNRLVLPSVLYSRSGSGVFLSRPIQGHNPVDARWPNHFRSITCPMNAQFQEQLVFTNDFKIRFCNGFSALQNHLRGCNRCSEYIALGDGDLCDTGKTSIKSAMILQDDGSLRAENRRGNEAKQNRLNYENKI